MGLQPQPKGGTFSPLWKGEAVNKKTINLSVFGKFPTGKVALGIKKGSSKRGGGPTPILEVWAFLGWGREGRANFGGGGETTKKNKDKSKKKKNPPPGGPLPVPQKNKFFFKKKSPNFLNFFLKGGLKIRGGFFFNKGGGEITFFLLRVLLKKTLGWGKKPPKTKRGGRGV